MATRLERKTHEMCRRCFRNGCWSAQRFARNVHVMRQQDRLGLILERLNRESSVTVENLAVQLEVSQASVRRDLQLLESQQL